jgi:uncharacterized membrane protein YedE/YeeE
MSENTSLEIEVLFKEFNMRFEEMTSHMQRYHSQVNMIHLYITIIAAIAGLIFSDTTGNFLNQIPGQHFKVVVGAVLILVVCLLYYFVAMMIESLYMTYVNGKRMGAIEILINRRMEKPLLVWETQIISEIHNPKTWHYKSWVKPNFLVGIWLFALFIAITFIITILLRFLVTLLQKRNALHFRFCKSG